MKILAIIGTAVVLAFCALGLFVAWQFVWKSEVPKIEITPKDQVLACGYGCDTYVNLLETKYVPSGLPEIQKTVLACYIECSKQYATNNTR
jgi:hypothetical protein